MNNKGRIAKEILQVLQPKPLPSQPFKSVRTQIRNSIARIIDFDDCSSSADDLVDLLIDSGAGKDEILRLLDQAIVAELKIFVMKVNTVISVSRGGHLQQVGDSVKVKLQKCSNLVIQMIKQINRRQKWCLCGRQVCLSQFDPSFTRQNIKLYIVSNLNEDILEEKTKTIAPCPSTFFNIRNDEECHMITLENIDRDGSGEGAKGKVQPRLKEEDSVVEYLRGLKINDLERRDCYLDGQWMERLKGSLKGQQM